MLKLILNQPHWRLYCNETEQDVIKLINKLFWGSDANSINLLLFKLTNSNEEICERVGCIKKIKKPKCNLLYLGFLIFIGLLHSSFVDYLPKNHIQYSTFPLYLHHKRQICLLFSRIQQN